MATDPLWKLKTLLGIRHRLRRVLPIIDALTALPTFLAAAYFLALKRVGLRDMPLNKAALQRVGVWPVWRHYYEPYFDTTMLRRPLDEPRDLPGLDLRPDAAADLLLAISRFGEEPIVGRVEGGLSYRAENGTYGLPDAALLYGIVRHFKPKRIVEVGSGNSTLVVLKALAANRLDGHPCDHQCIEPFEMPWLERSSARVHRVIIEDAPIELFEALEAGDVLFIDTSHMIRPQGDVLTIVQKLLPRVAPGVLVHIHDLFTPRDYPEQWLLRHRLMWNEQYLVEAFLTMNEKFEVLVPANHLYRDRREVFDRARPELRQGEWQPPTSFWLKRAHP